MDKVQIKIAPDGILSSAEISNGLEHARRSASGAASAMSVEDLFGNLSSSMTHGLSSAEASRRQLANGYNEFTVSEEEHIVVKFLEQFKNPLIMLLMGSVFVSVLMGHLDDAVSITMAIVIVVTVAFVQEYRSEKSIEELSKLVPPRCHCIRDGSVIDLLARELVTGDVITLAVGDRVPADCRLFEVSELHIDESSLTGETDPVEKYVTILPNGPALPVAERKNVVYMGTLVVKGRAKALVVGTGEASEFGAVFHMMQEVGDRKTPLQEKMDDLGKHLSMFSFGVIAFIGLVGLIRGQPLMKMFTIGVSLAVAAIPEGLPICVTVTLALGVIRMAKKSAIIKKLPAVEALGCTNVVCVDKTGTLTQNEMTVTEIYLPTEGQLVEVAGGGYFEDGVLRLGPARVDAKTHQGLNRLMQVGVLCNHARLTVKERKLFGQPTEGALLACARKAGLGEQFREGFEVTQEIPFNSDRKWMAVQARPANDATQAKVWYMKGMFEAILPRCSTIELRSGSLGQFSKQDVAKAEAEASHMAQRGLRVLALAYGSSVEEKLTFAGLVGIIDPPRMGVADAVSAMASSGVRTVMITGDSRDTAIAVAQKLGIFSPGVNLALSGEEVERLSLADFEEKVSLTTVFYRTTPRQKLKIVQAIQGVGEVVAMTGDGVNDAPALKASDIGIAMGRSGTDVSKEAAHMILVDDNFSTIMGAMEEGKSIYYNIKNFLRFQLSTSVAALTLVTLSTVFGMPTPLNAMQILWINIIMDGPPAQSLGVEPVDHDVMRRPPRRKDDSMITPQLVERVLTSAFMIVCGTLYIFLTELEDGALTRRDTTMTFTTFVLFDMFNAMSCRSEGKSIFKIGLFSNKHFCCAVGASLVSLTLRLSGSMGRQIRLSTPRAITSAAALLPLLSSLLRFFISHR